MSGAGGYSELVARLFREAEGGAGAGEGWVAGEAREPLSATHVRFHLRVGGGRVLEARYQVRGCPHTIAATAIAAAELPGTPLEGQGPDVAGLAARIGAPETKLGRLFVIQDAIRDAFLTLRRGSP
jgi:hypothetical protein